MATLGQYRKAQTKSGAAAESGLQALMLLMQYMQQQQDRKEDRETRVLSNELLELQKKTYEQNLSKFTEEGLGVPRITTIEELRDQEVVTSNMLELSEWTQLITNPRTHNKEDITTALASEITGSADYGNLGTGPAPRDRSRMWAKGMRNIQEIRAQIPAGVDKEERAAFVGRLEKDLAEAMGLYGESRIESQRALARTVMKRGLRSTTLEQMQNPDYFAGLVAEMPFVEEALELDDPSNKRLWMHGYKGQVQGAFRDAAFGEGGWPKFAQDVMEEEQLDHITADLDYEEAMENATPEQVNEIGRILEDGGPDGGPAKAAEYMAEHFPTSPGFIERTGEVLGNVGDAIVENPVVTTAVALKSPEIISWARRIGGFIAEKAGPFGRSVLKHGRALANPTLAVEAGTRGAGYAGDLLGTAPMLADAFKGGLWGLYSTPADILAKEYRGENQPLEKGSLLAQGSVDRIGSWLVGGDEKQRKSAMTYIKDLRKAAAQMEKISEANTTFGTSYIEGKTAQESADLLRGQVNDVLNVAQGIERDREIQIQEQEFQARQAGLNSLPPAYPAQPYPAGPPAPPPYGELHPDPTEIMIPDDVTTIPPQGYTPYGEMRPPLEMPPGAPAEQAFQIPEQDPLLGLLGARQDPSMPLDATFPAPGELPAHLKMLLARGILPVADVQKYALQQGPTEEMMLQGSPPIGGDPIENTYTPMAPSQDVQQGLPQGLPPELMLQLIMQQAQMAQGGYSPSSAGMPPVPQGY